MDEKDYISMGLNGTALLKLILCGEVEEAEKYPEKFYMVYSVPLNVDLTTLSHYPSIEISQEDLQ